MRQKSKSSIFHFYILGSIGPELSSGVGWRTRSGSLQYNPIGTARQRKDDEAPNSRMRQADAPRAA